MTNPLFVAMVVLAVTSYSSSGRGRSVLASDSPVSRSSSLQSTHQPRQADWRLREDRVFSGLQSFGGRYDIRFDGLVVMRDEATGAMHFFPPNGGPTRVVDWPLSEVSSIDALGPRFLDNGLMVLVANRGGKVFIVDTMGVVKHSWQRAEAGELRRDLNYFWVDREQRLIVARNHQQETVVGEMLVYPTVRTGGPPRLVALPKRDPPPALAVLTVVRNGVPRESRSLVPTHPTGAVTVGPSGEVLWTQGDVYQVYHRLDTGRDTLVARREQAPVPVGPDERTQYTDQIVAQKRFTDSTWTWTGPAVRNRHPAIEGLNVDDQGRIWVTVPMASTPIPEAKQRPPVVPGYPPTRWAREQAFDVFDPSGRFLARVPLGAWPQSPLARIVGRYLYMPRVDQEQGRVDLVRYEILTD